MHLKIHYIRFARGVYLEILEQSTIFTTYLRSNNVRTPRLGWKISSSSTPEVSGSNLFLRGDRVDANTTVLSMTEDRFNDFVDCLKDLSTKLGAGFNSTGDVSFEKTNFKLDNGFEFMLSSDDSGLYFMVLNQPEGPVIEATSFPVLYEGVKIDKDFISVRAANDPDPWKMAFYPCEDANERKIIRDNILNPFNLSCFSMTENMIEVG